MIVGSNPTGAFLIFNFYFINHNNLFSLKLLINNKNNHHWQIILWNTWYSTPDLFFPWITNLLKSVSTSRFLKKCDEFKLIKQTKSSTPKCPFLSRSISATLKPDDSKSLFLVHPWTSFFQNFSHFIKHSAIYSMKSRGFSSSPIVNGLYSFDEMVSYSWSCCSE